MQKPRCSIFKAAILSLFLLLCAAVPSQAALNAYAQLTLNGTDLTGFTSLHTIGGVNVSTGHIECYGVNHEIFSEGSRGGLTHTPFKLVKRVDKASPLLYKALSQNETVSGIIKYFHTNPDDGSTELMFTIEFAQARISGVRHWSPNNRDAAATSYPQMEEVSITYGRITFVDHVDHNEHEISVTTNE